MENDRPELDLLGQYALRFVKPGQTLGLGTGRAAAAFIRALGRSRIKVRGVATSHASEELARSVGIELISLADAGRIDIDFDGADEVDPRLNLIKGYGGALVREKIVAASSRRFVVLVGEEKMVRKLGERRSLPVEVVPFAVPLAVKRIRALGLHPNIRNHGNEIYVSDNGNTILDCGLRVVGNSSRLERDLHVIPGVVGTGLFVGMADVVLVAQSDGKIRTLRRRR
ncbi:MAG TPA: ribose-5-phosphate isomerase RpiA [Candidatus Binataceae bacterium]|nr:ribose-5-phosphate isomerase RpiA [Candidatus Binataceae bacterium]